MSKDLKKETGENPYVVYKRSILGKKAEETPKAPEKHK